MQKRQLKRVLLGPALALGFSLAAWQTIEACTRVVYIGTDGIVITGRSMDWVEDISSNLWAFPRGIKRDGAAGPNSASWVAKYGSVVVSGYESATADGMNEAGLVANLLYLAESDYGKPDPARPVISISTWAQYALDNFATVAEAVDALAKEPFVVIASKLPNGDPAQLHLSLSDSSGDSAIFEYLGGKLIIHHGKQYTVMTNSPRFEEQLALNRYWEDVGGNVFLPGTSRAADRFARATFLINAIPTRIDPHYIKGVPDESYANQAAASVISVMRAVSVPLGVATTGEPNVASTLWRIAADQRDKVYFFDSATSPNVFWVPLADLDLKEGAVIKKLTIAGGRVFAGNAADKFVPAQPFKFLPATVE